MTVALVPLVAQVNGKDLETRSPDFRSKQAWLMDSMTKCSHPCLDFYKKTFALLVAAIVSRESLAAFAKLGPNTAQRVRRDAGCINLAAVAKNFIVFRKSVDASCKDFAEWSTINEQDAGKDFKFIKAILEVDMKPCINVEWEMLKDAVNEHANILSQKCAEVVKKTGDVVQQKQAGGEQDWKKEIPNDHAADIQKVLPVADAALSPVEGKHLGDCISAMEEVGARDSRF